MNLYYQSLSSRHSGRHHPWMDPLNKLFYYYTLYQEISNSQTVEKSVARSVFALYIIALYHRDLGPCWDI